MFGLVFVKLKDTAPSNVYLLILSRSIFVLIYP